MECATPAAVRICGLFPFDFDGSSDRLGLVRSATASDNRRKGANDGPFARRWAPDPSCPLGCKTVESDCGLELASGLRGRRQLLRKISTPSRNVVCMVVALFEVPRSEAPLHISGGAVSHAFADLNVLDADVFRDGPDSSTVWQPDAASSCSSPFLQPNLLLPQHYLCIS